MKLTLTSVSFIVFTASYVRSVKGQSACADQAVFDLCRQNQDKYLATCSVTDYRCLCQWNTAKLGCWRSCPNDITKGTQENIVSADCSVPGANVTISWSSSAVTTPTSTSTTIVPTNGAAVAKPSSNANPSIKLASNAMVSAIMMTAAYFLTC